MTKNLRTKHVYAWALLSVLLPAIIIIGQLVIPKEVHQSLLQPQAVSPLPLTIRKVEGANYVFSLRSSNDSTQLQLEWINKTVLSFPTATVYAVDKNNEDVKTGKLIGRIEARGTYEFKLDSSFKPLLYAKGRFIVYDFIHNQIIDSLNL